jgi:hypothetical protein
MDKNGARRLSFAKSMVLIMLFLGVTVYADPVVEIDHLMDFVASSACEFERNGKIYTGSEARDHIHRKYDHFRNKIKTAEDFIEYSATKSEFSGRAYQTHCPEVKVQNTADWLLGELQVLRKN